MNVMVYPVIEESEHNLEGLDCWCVPKYLLPCDECDEMEPLVILPVRRLHADTPEQAQVDVAGCWKCVEGMIALTREEAEACERTVIIVHHRTGA